MDSTEVLRRVVRRRTLVLAGLGAADYVTLPSLTQPSAISVQPLPNPRGSGNRKLMAES